MNMKQLSDTFLVSNMACIDEEISRLDNLIPYCTTDTYKDYIFKAIRHLEEARACVNTVITEVNQIDKEKK